ncbi:MAG: type II toxin-antitoxin system PemK/MazF family toxin [Clostridia bacterium]|nr:type II toxin-antitoxin system PemK/MazF family toxin [Clostridia bacterium]
MPEFKEYDLWWTMVKFEDDPDRQKERPVMVMSPRNDSATGFYVTSQNPRPGERDFVIRDWKAAGLTKPSTIRLDRRVPLSKEICREKIGNLSRNDRILLGMWLADPSKVHQ